MKINDQLDWYHFDWETAAAPLRNKIVQMLWLLSIVLLFLLLIAYLLFAPLSIEINTERNWYCIRYHRLASVFVGNENNHLSVWIKVLFWKRRLRPGTGMQKQVSDKKAPGTSKRKSLSWKKLVAVIRSFQVKRCELNIDTGDVQLNGILYPFFYWISWYTGREIRISFTGETKIILEIQNNLARMARAWIRS